MEDDRWEDRGEFDRQQDGWKMTAGWVGVRFSARGVEDDHQAERGEFDLQQGGWRMTPGWGGVRMTTGWRRESLTASSVSAYREASFKS